MNECSFIYQISIKDRLLIAWLLIWLNSFAILSYLTDIIFWHPIANYNRFLFSLWLLINLITLLRVNLYLLKMLLLYLM